MRGPQKFVDVPRWATDCNHCVQIFGYLKDDVFPLQFLSSDKRGQVRRQWPVAVTPRRRHRGLISLARPASMTVKWNLRSARRRGRA